MTLGRVAAMVMISRIAERGMPAARVEGGRVAAATELDMKQLSKVRNGNEVGLVRFIHRAQGAPENRLVGRQHRQPELTLEFSQLVKATDALRTGSYSKTLTYTLSTTTP